VNISRGRKKMTEKKPKKAITYKKLKKSENQIEQWDALTFYVKSQSNPTKNPYFIYNSMGKGWLCDCMYFVMNLTDDGHTKPCKHIEKVKEFLKNRK